jgi:hypothetical protein
MTVHPDSKTEECDEVYKTEECDDNVWDGSSAGGDSDDWHPLGFQAPTQTREEAWREESWANNISLPSGTPLSASPRASEGGANGHDQSSSASIASSRVRSSSDSSANVLVSEELAHKTIECFC